MRTPASTPRKLKRTKTMRTDRVAVTSDQSTSVVIPRAMSAALPKQLSVKLRYYEYLSLDPVAGGAAVNVFSANGAYDPNITGGGHQPRGLDQYFALYAKGIVTSGTCLAKGMSTTAADVGLIGIALLNTTSTYTNPTPYIEDPRCSWFQFANTVTTNDEARITFGSKSFFDYKNPIDESDLHFTNATNPTQQAYYHVWFGAPNAGYNPGAIIVQVLVEYNITFFEPVALSSS